jgi:hypothetical protein
LRQEDVFGQQGQQSNRTVYVDAIYPRVSPASYRENLVEMIKLTREHDTQIVFLSLADSPRRAESLYRGIDLLEKGETAAAVEELGTVAYGSSIFSTLAKKYLVNILEDRNLHDEARKVGAIEDPIISLHGGKPLFLDSEYSDVMREVASDHDVLYVDGAAALQRHPEYYMDFSHFNENGHSLIAHRMAEVIRHMD